MNRAQRLLEACGVNEFFTGELQGIVNALHGQEKKKLIAALLAKKIDVANMSIEAVKLSGIKDPRIKDASLVKIVHFKAPDDDDALAIYSGANGKLEQVYGPRLDGVSWRPDEPLLKGPNGDMYILPKSYGGKISEAPWSAIIQYAWNVYMLDTKASAMDAELLKRRQLQKQGAINLDRDDRKQIFNQYGWDRANQPGNPNYNPDLPLAKKSDFWPDRGQRDGRTPGNIRIDKSGAIVDVDKYRKLLRDLKAEAGIEKVIDDALATADSCQKFLAEKARKLAAGGGSTANRLLGGWSSDDLARKVQDVMSCIDGALRTLGECSDIQADMNAETDPEKKKSFEWSLKYRQDELKRSIKEIAAADKTASDLLKKQQAT